MGLAMVTPASGFICFKIGQALDARAHTSWIAIVALLIGCAAGMYETFRQAMRIEGFDKRGKKDDPPK